MKLDDERFRKEIRWSKIAMVPQASMNSLNPVIRIEDQLKWSHCSSTKR